MSTLETMESLGISESNVKNRLNRAKEMLRNDLKNYWKAEQLFEFNLVRCDVIVEHVIQKIYNS